MVLTDSYFFVFYPPIPTEKIFTIDYSDFKDS